MLLERDGPLEALLATARSAAAGRGGTVLLEGEAGIGKTSLLQEFVERAGEGCRVLWGWCEALFTPRPLGPLQDMAQSLDPQVAALLDQAAAPERLFPALLNALQQAEGTTVLVFEDVHWADNATLDLIKYLGRRVSVLRTMLVLSARSDEIGADHPLTHVRGDLPSGSVTRIRLEPLSSAAVTMLAEQAGRSGADLSNFRGHAPGVSQGLWNVKGFFCSRSSAWPPKAPGKNAVAKIDGGPLDDLSGLVVDELETSVS